MKKIERSTVYLEENLALLQCPVCKEAFQEVSNQGVKCANNHHFDLGKKGTLHLLLKGGQNDYDKSMLSSRKALADTGFFHPILDAILKHIPQDATLLDVGCGEGSHLHYLTEQGLDDLKKELDNLINVKRPENIIAIKEARALGDLSENAEYDAARNEQAQIEARIKQIEKIYSLGYSDEEDV